MSTFPFQTEIGVRGYEIDSWGHVNNAVYLNWLEHARWELFKEGGDFLTALDGTLPVVRFVELDYRRETLFGDRLRVGIWPRKVGNTSFTLGGSVRIVDALDPARVGQLALCATMVFACIRRGEGTVRVPDPWRTHFPGQDPGMEPPAPL